jgi:hypothetical protein
MTSRDEPVIVTRRLAVRKNNQRRMRFAKKEPTVDAVRKIVGQDWVMAHKGSTRFFPKTRLKSCRGRGEVYSLLQALHTQAAKMLAKDEPSWPVAAAEMARDEGKRRYGEAPTANAKGLWQRVFCGVLVEHAVIHRSGTVHLSSPFLRV